MTERFDLPGELTIFSAAETHAALLAWIARQPAEPAQPLEVDAQQVLDLDGAGVQLLCALSALLEHKGWEWRLLSPTGTLTKACRTLGLSGWLEQHTATEPA